MSISMSSITNARVNFDFALGDVKILLSLHDQRTGGGKGRPARELEVLKRAGVILAVTAWETFIEDTLEERFQAKIKAAQSPKDVESTFNSVAQAWLAREKLKPPELAKWALDGWKAILTEKLSEEIGELNTPNSAKVRALFKRYISEDITKDWRWKGVSAPAACGRLDALIRLRGGLVHRGRELFEEKASVRRNHVVNAIALLERLVDRTEASLGIGPAEVSI
jgi:RiboL-PSP-HEPN